MQKNVRLLESLYSELRLLKMSHYKQTLKGAKKQLQLHVLNMIWKSLRSIKNKRTEKLF